MPYTFEDRALETAHKLTLDGRGHLSVSGVSDVESFDEQTIVMETSGGTLVVNGEELSISRLSTDQGDVNVQGRIDALHYEESRPRLSLWARLFR